MPLNIYFKNLKDIAQAFTNHKDIEGLPLIWDVEQAFRTVKLSGTDTERQLISEIEQGEYLDNLSFKDRFGYKLPRDFLSTGCKAALVVLHNPDKFVNTIECGGNALGAIITYCTEGNIPLYTDENKIPYFNDGLAKSISVQLDGIHFTDFDKLNNYIADH